MCRPNFRLLVRAGLIFVSLASYGSASAAIVTLTSSTPGNLGSVLDNQSTGTFAVPELPGLNVTIVSISGDPSTGTTLQLNTGSNDFGINSPTTGTADDIARFDSILNESVTLRFDRDVEITEIDFVGFSEATDVFNFAGVSFTMGNNVNGSSQVADLSSSPLTILANTDFVLEATSGRIGLQDFTAVAVPEPSSFAVLLVLGIMVSGLRRKRLPV